MGKENLKKLHKPFIKRVGWKRQLLSQLEKFYPENFNTYFEPFVWWGAVFFDLRNKFWDGFPAHLFDINSEMIIAYNTIKCDAKWLIEELWNYPYEKEFFLKIRNRDREPDYTKKKDVQRAARFIYYIEWIKAVIIMFLLAHTTTQWFVMKTIFCQCSKHWRIQRLGMMILKA